MKIKKLHDDFIMPKYATSGSAAFDIHAVEDFDIDMGYQTDIKLGFSAHIPDGFCGLLIPRSGLGSKYGMRLSNTCGLIDSDYRGEWRATLEADSDLSFKKGDRILQCVIMPVYQVELELSEDLDDTERGEGGYGSTGI